VISEIVIGIGASIGRRVLDLLLAAAGPGLACRADGAGTAACINVARLRETDSHACGKQVFRCAGNKYS
jgi:hypothetical protein